MSSIVGSLVRKTSLALAQRRDPIAVELLVRPGCHLCEDAMHALRPVFGSRNISVINILSDRLLEDEYVFRIPVVRYAGVVLAEGLISPSDAIAARAAALRVRVESRHG